MELTERLIGRRAFLSTSAAALTTLAAHDLYAQDAKGVVAHWTADGGKPDELLDKSGKNNHAKLNGGKKIEERLEMHPLRNMLGGEVYIPRLIIEEKNPLLASIDSIDDSS